MKICPITYDEFDEEGLYSKNGLKKLASNLEGLNVLGYSAQEQRDLSLKMLEKMSIQGFQPKISAKLSIKEKAFIPTETGGTYILKPQTSDYQELPENEDLTMKLANRFEIETPLHGLLYSKDKTFTYFIKRFDRFGKNKKIYVEDFAQLAGLNRDTKYEYSYEKCILLIENFCTFPELEKIKFFKMLLFSFVIGNDDLHLKNLSLIKREDIYQFTPGYDFVNVHLAMGAKPRDELALTLQGKRKKLNYDNLIKYFAIERLGINEKIVSENMKLLKKNEIIWEKLIQKSFLSPESKDNYRKLIEERFNSLNL